MNKKHCFVFLSLRNISNPTIRTAGLDFKAAQFGSKSEDLQSSPIRIGGFKMTSHTNKSLLEVRWINFDPVQGLNYNFDPVLGLS